MRPTHRCVALLLSRVPAVLREPWRRARHVRGRLRVRRRRAGRPPPLPAHLRVCGAHVPPQGPHQRWWRRGRRRRAVVRAARGGGQPQLVRRIPLRARRPDLGPHIVHSHTVHLPLGALLHALLTPCTMCGSGLIVGDEFGSDPRVPTAVGYCAATDSQSRFDCARSDKGAWDAAAANISSLAACVARCRGCQRCRWVSWSAEHGDCSWYYACTTMHTNHDGASYVTRRVRARRRSG